MIHGIVHAESEPEDGHVTYEMKQRVMLSCVCGSHLHCSFAMSFTQRNPSSDDHDSMSMERTSSESDSWCVADDEPQSDDVAYESEDLPDEQKQWERSRMHRFLASHEPLLPDNLASTWEPEDYQGPTPTDSEPERVLVSFDTLAHKMFYLAEQGMAISSQVSSNSDTESVEEKMDELGITPQIITQVQSEWVRTIGYNDEASARSLLRVFPNPDDAARAFGMPQTLLLAKEEDDTTYHLKDLIGHRRNIKEFIDACAGQMEASSQVSSSSDTESIMEKMNELGITPQIVTQVQSVWVRTVGYNYEAGARSLLRVFPNPGKATRAFDIPQTLLLTKEEDDATYRLEDLIGHRRKIKDFIDACARTGSMPPGHARFAM